ncbi:unnamed protein product [Diamesa serratosioi]
MFVHISCSINKPSLDSVEDFEINSKLIFILDGVDKLINYKITVKNGYSVYTDVEPSESIHLESLLSLPIEDFSYHNFTESFDLDNDKLQWTNMNDGRLFYQIYNPENIINGHYTLQTSDKKYHSISYSIIPFKSNLTTDLGKSDYNNEDKYNTDKPAFDLHSFVASGNSCANSGKVTDNEPKHYIFQGGFFYIHSLSNGESVVMYKLPNQEILPVQYTFLNPDCMYVTYRYDILENSTMINESEVSESIDDFFINGTLTFTLQDYTEADQEAYYNYMSEIVEGDLVLKYFFDKNGIHVIGIIRVS